MIAFITRFRAWRRERREETERWEKMALWAARHVEAHPWMYETMDAKTKALGRQLIAKGERKEMREYRKFLRRELK